MMDKQKYKPFSLSRATSILVFLAILGTGACSIRSTLKSHHTGYPEGLGEKLAFDIQTELSSQEVASGSIALLRVKVPAKTPPKGFRAEFEGIELPFFPVESVSADETEGPRFFATVLSVPYDRIPGPAFVKITWGEGSQAVEEKVHFDVVDGKYPSEVLRVDRRRVNPKNPKDLARIAREQKELSAIYKQVTLEKYWTGPFLRPVSGDVTSAFGTRRVYNGKLKSYHSGLDLRAPMKTPIYAGAPGVVVLSKSLFYTGNTVILDHGYGVITLYCHMSKIKVKKGDRVDAKQLLGLSGKTGRVTGPHLHWQAVVHQVKVNPVGLIEVLR